MWGYLQLGVALGNEDFSLAVPPDLVAHLQCCPVPVGDPDEHLYRDADWGCWATAETVVR